MREFICGECLTVIPGTLTAMEAHYDTCGPNAEFQEHKPELLQHIVNMTETLPVPENAYVVDC